MDIRKWSLRALSPGAWALTTLLALGVAPAQAITLGSVDTFTAGNNNGWVTGAASPVAPVVVNSGGPAGAGDGYLLATSLGGSGAGSRLVVFNESQWLGNYIAAGVTAITMDLNNLGSTALSIHLQFTGTAGLAYSAGVSLPVGSGWQHVSFSLAPAALTGTAAVLNDVTELRLFHGGSTSPIAIAAQLGLDNVAAVPEPASAAMALAGLFAMAGMVRRRRPAC